MSILRRDATRHDFLSVTHGFFAHLQDLFCYDTIAWIRRGAFLGAGNTLFLHSYCFRVSTIAHFLFGFRLGFCFSLLHFRSFNVASHLQWSFGIAFTRMGSPLPSFG
jgi:hypothetical protein